MSSNLRFSLLAVAVCVVAVVVLLDPFAEPDPITRLGTAGVALGDDTARAVERVSYRQDVERIGDVVLVDGAPRDEIVDDDIARMWEVVDRLWPTGLRDELVQLSVVNEEPRGLVGVVHPATTGGWILSLDRADLDDVELVEETIVHELSHVVTLEVGLFTFGDVEDCSGTQIALGCAETGTLLSAFADRFWAGDVGSAESSDFVNDYASTAAHEDLSETFTAWVLGWPVEGDAIDAKIDLMAADPDLLLLATDLRARLAG